MTQQEDWIAETPRRRWVSRLLAPGTRARPTASAFAVGALAAAAFVASLVLDWQSITLSRTIEATQTSSLLTYSDSVISPATLGQVYALGVVGLVGLVGAVIGRAELALRFRLAAASLTVGLLGVVLAITVTLPETLTYQAAQFGVVTSPDGVGPAVVYEPGLLCAYAAVVLPIVAIWLASRPAVRPVLSRNAAGGDRFSIARHAARDAEDPARPELMWRADEPLELSVTPER